MMRTHLDRARGVVLHLDGGGDGLVLILDQLHDVGRVGGEGAFNYRIGNSVTLISDLDLNLILFLDLV